MTALPAVAVDTHSPTPPYEQLRTQLEELIRGGVLAPGQRLPPLRQLAADLGLAVGTAARAYKELEAQGLVRSRRGAGTRVASSSPALTHQQRHLLLQQATAAYVRQAVQLGMTSHDILSAVTQTLALPTQTP